MEIVFDELENLRFRYHDEKVRSLFSSIDFVIYGVRRNDRVPAVCELLMHRPYTRVENYQTRDELISVLVKDESEPAIVVVEGADESAGINDMIAKFGPRIFTIGFQVNHIDRLVQILRSRGAQFLTDEIQARNTVRSISTTQSNVTRDSYVYIERENPSRRFDFFPNATPFAVELAITETLKKKKRLKAFKLMNGLDHIAYRVHDVDIVSVVEEIMKFTPYEYAEAHEIEEHDAKTVVFRFDRKKPALVASYGRSVESVVEQYVNHYGPRVHHMAYEVANIFHLVMLQKKRGMTFTTDEVIGTKEEGIVQIFSTPSERSNEITEYVERFDGFTGFFSNKNVGNLMSSTRAYQ